MESLAPPTRHFLLLIVGAILVAFAIMVWRASPGRLINQRFTTFTVLVACWAVGVAGSHGAVLQNLWLGVSFASAALIPAGFLGFVTAYDEEQRATHLVRCVYAVGIGFAMLSLTSSLVVYDATIIPELGPSRKTGPFYPVFAAYVILGWSTAFWMLCRTCHRSRGRARAELQYLGIAMVTPVGAAVLTNLVLPLATGHSQWSWIGPCFGLVFIGIVSHAIIRHRLMDLRLVASPLR